MCWVVTTIHRNLNAMTSLSFVIVFCCDKRSYLGVLSSEAEAHYFRLLIALRSSLDLQLFTPSGSILFKCWFRSLKQLKFCWSLDCCYSTKIYEPENDQKSQTDRPKTGRFLHWSIHATCGGFAHKRPVHAFLSTSSAGLFTPGSMRVACQETTPLFCV